MSSANGNGRAGRRNVFGAPEDIRDNVGLLEYFELVRRMVHAGAVELGVTAAEVEARLRNVSPESVVGGLGSRRRAKQVSRPVELAAESLTVASQYMVTAANRFNAVYMPELEAAGAAQRRRRDFTFKAA